MASNKNLWKFVNKIWQTGEDRKDAIAKYHAYWNGDLASYHIISDTNQTKTASNIVKPIIETKVKSILDTQFIPGVVPNIKVFSNADQIKEAGNIADVYHAEILHILKANNFEKLQEQVCREGLISGAGILQVLWNTERNVEGDIKLSVIDPKNLKWDVKATSIENASFIGYSLTMNSSVAKNKYCRNTDGTFNIVQCKKIDDIASTFDPRKDSESNIDNNQGAQSISTFQTEETTGLAYRDNKKASYQGIKYDQVIDLIVLFLLDDGLYSPSETDDPSETKEKKQGLRLYPNGRMIIFASNKKHKLIFEDVTLDDTFKNLGNIDFFYPMSTSNIYGRGEVEDLYTIQDRINGVYNKYMTAMQNSFSTLVVDKDSDLGMSDLVRQPIIYGESLSVGFQPYVVSNNGIEEASHLMGMIESLKDYAYEQARVNSTMLYGTRQTGTTSASQIEALQESPLTDIRQLQRNFKDFIINVGEKCLKLIQENYKFNRLIKLVTDIDGAKYAQFQYNPNEQGEGERKITLLDEAMQTVREIIVDKDWEFKVEVIAGTEIPRTRKESIELLEGLIEKGILPLDNLDMLELYLKSLDFPQARGYISLLKKQKEDLEKRPPQPTIEDLVKTPDVARAFAEIFKALEGHPLAQGEMLQKLGMNPETSTLKTAPIDKITSKADVMDIVSLVPEKISANPQQNQEGKKIAITKEMLSVIK